MADSLPHIPPTLAKALLKRYPEVRDTKNKPHANLIFELAQRDFVIWLNDQCEEQQRTRN
jgi:hypothetical protein